MAISRDKKNELVAELKELFETAKTSVFATYQGLSVADMQKLRAEARQAGVVIKVVKNRLVKVALAQVEAYKTLDNSSLSGQLLYAICASDEVAPAKVLNDFAKSNDNLVIAGGLTVDSGLISAEEVKSLAALPSKGQLIAEVISQLLSPIHDITGALSGNIHALLDGIGSKATN